MTVVSIVKIQQFSTQDSDFSVENTIFSPEEEGNVRDSTLGKETEFTYTHLRQVSNPTASSPSRDGWHTENKNDWSDSPTSQPNLLYRYRFGFGRDYREESEITLGQDGLRLGKLDDASGVILYQRLYTLDGETEVRDFKYDAEGQVRQKTFNLESNYSHLHHMESIEGEGDVSQFPFLLLAIPEPFSLKNPVDTDIFIRLSNFSTPLASGTISLYVDGILRLPIDISEFFGGLGGFDILWANNFIFDYDAEVRVRLTYSDTTIPANEFEIEYPFYTVPDLARPRITNLIPSENSTGVAINSAIQFDLLDFEIGVDIDTLKLYVNGKLITSGVDGTIQITELEDGTGYTVRYTPTKEWLYNDYIPIAVFVKDLSIHENELFYSYGFTTEQSLSPELVETKPQPCIINVSTGTDVSVVVVDGGHGLDESTILFSINEKEPEKVHKLPIVFRDE
jgi:hypothetical protein